MQVSVIATVKNESGSVAGLLESLCTQTRPPDEVVIVDGGSTDGTLEQLRVWEQNRRLPLRVLVEPGCNISRGRNTAIRAAHHPIVASTDAGVRAEPSWLANLILPFAAEGTAAVAFGETIEIPPVVACGFFVPETTTPFETAIGATVLPALADVKRERFLPSSRSVAFPKSAWEAVGGYPEWLDYCEDLILDFRLRARGYRFVFVPNAIVHFRPRNSLGAFFRQYYRYARGDGKADLWPTRHAARYLTYGVALPILLWLAMAHSALWVVPLLLGATAMFWTPYKRLLPILRALAPRERLAAVLWVPVIRMTGDIAKMLGYPVGWYWRWLHRQEIPRWRD